MKLRLSVLSEKLNGIEDDIKNRDDALDPSGINPDEPIASAAPKSKARRTRRGGMNVRFQRIQAREENTSDLDVVVVVSHPPGFYGSNI